METITILAIICSCLSVAVLVLCTCLVCFLYNRKEADKQTKTKYELDEIERLNQETCIMINEIIKEVEKEYLSDNRKQ